MFECEWWIVFGLIYNNKELQMKKINIILILLITTISCNKKDEVVTITLAGSEAVGSLGDRTAQKLRDYVNEQNTDLKINYIQGEALGSIQDVIEQQIQGSIDLVIVRPLWFSSFIDDFQILSWGFTFRDAEHMQRFFDSDLFRNWTEEIQNTLGLKMLGASVDQPRILFSTKPIRTIDDIKGLKIRVPHIKAYIELWTGLGALPTQIAWSEAFLSLQTGVADAAEADLAGAMSQRFYIPAPYIMKTEHVFSGYSFTANNEKYSTLSDEHKKIVQAGVEHALTYLKSQSAKESDELLQKMVDEGATIVDFDKSELQQVIKTSTTEMEAEGLWSKGLWEHIQAL